MAGIVGYCPCGQGISGAQSPNALSPTNARRGFPGVQLLDLAGPVEVFNVAPRFRPGSYDVELVAPSRTVETSSPLELAARRLPRGRHEIDTLVVAGGAGAIEASEDRALVAWIGRSAERARRTISVCTGAFLLTSAGLLEGRRATTHWSACDELARRYPGVTVERDPIFVRDGEVFTSAGVTAGMDLALALVEDDLGPELALEVARWLVVFLKRTGGQAQFSAVLRPSGRAPSAARAPRVAPRLPIGTRAARVHMGERNFTRAFRGETGVTPAVYVERLPVERARTLLEDGERSLERVAGSCGFPGAELLRRAFQRNLGIPPSAYRDHFQSAA